MSEIATDPAVVAPAPSFLERHHFLLRRLHSLSGLVPVGLFVCMHLFTNFQMMIGDYQHEVEFIHSLPALFLLEMSIWLGIGFHAVLGFIYTLGGKVNNTRYGYFANLRYTLQRVTGIIALVFIFVHIATLRWRWGMFGIFTPFYVAGPDGHPLATASTALALQSSRFMLVLYIIGVFSVVYHWSNGLWTAAITWGLTISVQAQRRWGYLCIGLFVFLSVCSAGAIISSLTYNVSDADKASMAGANADWKAGKPIRDAAIHDEPVVKIKPGSVPEAPDADSGSTDSDSTAPLSPKQPVSATPKAEAKPAPASTQPSVSN